LDNSNLEHRWFEFDRRTVLSQIDLVHRTIDGNAKELSMVAVEGVFEKSISDELSRTSRSLQTLARQLGVLRARVATADGYPKDSKASGVS